jgi:hypothetical protein
MCHYNIRSKWKITMGLHRLPKLCMRCGHEVPGMVLLYAHWEGLPSVLPLNCYALSLTMLPLLETSLELLLWNSFKCCHFFWMSLISWNLHPFKADFVFGNSQKSSRAKTRVIGCVFHFSNQFFGQKLLDREHLVSQSIVMVENILLGQSLRLFRCFSISTL